MVEDKKIDKDPVHELGPRRDQTVAASLSGITLPGGCTFRLMGRLSVAIPPPPYPAPA